VKINHRDAHTTTPKRKTSCQVRKKERKKIKKERKKQGKKNRKEEKDRQVCFGSKFLT